MTARKKFEVPQDQLRLVCDPASFPFQDTAGVEPIRDFIGQDRAIEALRFGLEIGTPGYNIFVTGLEGTGRNAVIREHLTRFVAEKQARGECQVYDYCYVYNFDDPNNPRLLVIEKGKGKLLRQDTEKALKNIQKALLSFFGSKRYSDKVADFQAQTEAKQKEFYQGVEELNQEAQKEGLCITSVPDGRGLVVVPYHSIEKRPLNRLEFEVLPEEKKKELDLGQEKFVKLLSGFIQKHQRESEKFRKEIEEMIEQFEKEQARKIAASVFKKLGYRDFPEIMAYFKELEEFVVKNLDLFGPQENHASGQGMLVMAPPKEDNGDKFLPFRVNVIIDNGATEGLPVIFEDHPTFFNLFGRIERKPSHGTYYTDHTKIRAGSLLRANGGYLVVNIRDLLVEFVIYEKFKRTLKTGKLQFEDPLERFGFLPSEGLMPEPISINVKVIVIGLPIFYHLLSEFDEDFKTIFKILAEFNFQMPNTEENKVNYAGFIAFCCQKENLLPFDQSGAIKVVEYGTRLAGNQKKLSTLFGLVKNLVVESSYVARQDGSSVVSSEHVQKALVAKRKRANLTEERIQEFIKEGTLLIDTDGAKAGQVNALAVHDSGDISFGAPSRVTAQTFIGKEDLINIEREVKMSGPHFDKAVFILKGYLGQKYAQERPLSVSISLGFEQSYGGIEGDSASLAELYAILSSISGLPVEQGLAITGSMNQKGEAQPIGGVNEKVEGFFDVCKARGLTGKQGVIIPHQNVVNLMLREDVVEAVSKGEFHVYAIKTADEGIELLFGRLAGEKKFDGTYPKGSAHQAVLAKLRGFSEKSRKFSKPQSE